MCTARLFSQVVAAMHSNFGQGRLPSTNLDVKKLQALGYAMVKTASLCVPSF